MLHVNAHKRRVILLAHIIGEGIAMAQCSTSRCGYFCNADHKCYHAEECVGVGQACRRVQQATTKATHKYRRCSVVSSSDALLEQRFGAEIDLSPVFRINMSPVHGFERYVGSRTDVAVTNTPSWLHGNEYINSSRFIKEVNAQRAPLKVYVQDPLTADDDVKCCYRRTTKRFRDAVKAALRRCEGAFRNIPRVTCESMNPHVAEVAWRATCRASKGKKSKCPLAPSSGLITIVLARTLCQSVRLFGFSETNSKHLGHYYAPKRKVGPEFNPSLEHVVLRAWHASIDDSLLSFATSSNRSTLRPSSLPPKSSSSSVEKSSSTKSSETSSSTSKSTTTTKQQQQHRRHRRHRKGSHATSSDHTKNHTKLSINVTALRHADAFLAALAMVLDEEEDRRPPAVPQRRIVIR